MIKKNLSELKNSNPFYPLDLIVYIILAAAISATFFIALTYRESGSSQGFYILYDNEKVAEYLYGDGVKILNDEYAAHFNVEGDKIRFYPNADNPNDYNLIAVDKENKTVSIADATCAGKDCTFQQVSEKGGFIYCAPHKLKIVRMGLSDPVSG